MDSIYNNNYIHSNIQPLNGLEVYPVEHNTNNEVNSGFVNYFKQCLMHSVEIPGCINHLFGFDKIELISPIFDLTTGEQIVDVDSIIQKLACSYTNECKRPVYKIQDKEQIETQENSEGYSVTKEFVKEYEAFNGYLADIPVQIGYKENDFYVQLTPSRIIKGHNASPIMPEKLYDACKIVSKVLGVDLWFFNVKSVEYAFGIATQRPIKSIVESLGDSRVSKNTKRFPMSDGVKWLHMSKGTSVQVYSTNLKNLNDSKKNYGIRCSEFDQLKNRGLDSIRIEMKRSFKSDNVLLKDIINPSRIIEQLKFFRKNIKSIHKNVSHIHSERLKNLDLNMALSSVTNTKDMLKFATSIGIAIIYDNMMSSLAHMKGVRRPRIVGALEKGLHYFEDSISNFVIKEHFHDIIINVIDYYIEYYTLEQNI
jgi:hypothetical protein